LKTILLLALAIALPASVATAQEAAPATVAALDLPDAPLPAPQQQSSSSQPQTQAPQQPTAEDEKARAARELKQEEQQRMLGVIPNFNSVMSGSAAPLTPAQKFHLFFKGSVDPFQFVAAGIDAGIEQAEDSYPGYHYGFEGYAKRYGASYADGFDGNFWGNAVLPSLFHQDPRYFRLGHGSVGRRIWYTVLSTVRCKGDDGNWQFNYSNITGNFIGGTISNVYYPSSDRGVGLTVERALTTTAEGAIGSLAVEFYPDVIGHLHHKKAVATPDDAATHTYAHPDA
jgi:hypothetical protein